MSRLNFKMIVASLCLVAATTATANAQLSQMRLFSPFPDDSFGGGAYMNEGFYGSIGAGIVSLTQAPDQIIGNTTDTGSGLVVTNIVPSTDVTTSTYTYTQLGNQINTSQFHAKWVTETDFTVGNIRGHHGWEVSGTVVSPQKNIYEGTYAGIVIEDPANVTISQTGKEGNYYYWDSAGGFTKMQEGRTYQIGRLWGIRGLNNTGSSGQSYTDDSDLGNTYAYVPIPITYDTFTLNSKINTWSVEAMYTYRFHPFRIGMLEFLAGIRYTEYDGNMDFLGHATTQRTTSYKVTDVQILESTSNQGTEIVTQTTSENYQDYEYDYSNSVGADLGYSNWNFEAQNHIVGPQVGGRYTITDNRWRFSGEGKFFAGFNRQNIYGYGNLGLTPTAEQGNDLDLTETGMLNQYAPINNVANSFAYSRHFNIFTPGGEVNIDATWNWTHAVSFKVGYQMLYLAHIANATAVNDYRINDDGTIFGVKEDKHDRNFDAFVHGVMFTVQVNR